MDTLGSGVARNEYAHTVVLWRSFWLQSTKTLPGPLIARHVHGDALLVARFEDPPDGERERLGRFGVDGRSQPDRQVDALRARGLRDDVQTELVEQVAHVERDARAVDDVGGRARVEVEDHRGGVPRIGGAGLRRVELERGEVGGPHEAGKILDRARLDVGIGVERDGLEPGGPVAGAALLEEPLALHPVGQAHHRERAVLEVGEQRRRRPGCSNRPPDLW